MRKVLLIINPRAGRNSKRADTCEIVKAFGKHGFECVEKTTTCRGDATEIAKNYSDGCEAVVCCGGDGTYNEVINGVMQSGKRLPLIYLPYGSTNDFANTLGIPKSPEKAAQMFADKVIQSYDIGKFNDRYFSYIASFGVGTDISYNTPQYVKNIIGHPAYILNGFVVHLGSVLKNLKTYHMKIEHDGKTIEDDFYFGAISNTNEVSGIFKFDKRGIKMNDGVFEVLLVKKINVAKIFQLFYKMLRQDYSDDAFILFNSSEVKISCDDDVAWTLDGEFGGAFREMTIKNEEKAIDLVSPKGKYVL